MKFGFRTSLLLLIASAGLLVSLWAPSLWSGVPQEARVTYLEGQVQEERAGKWEAIGLDQPVGSNQRIRTGPNARLEIGLGGSDFVRMDADTVAKIQFDVAQAPTRHLRVELENGDIWGDLESWNKSELMEVATPKAEAYVRGTRFSTSVSKEGEVRLAVYAGAVEIYDPKHRQKPNFSKQGERKEIAGPGEVAGPAEVDFDTWVLRVQAGKQMKIGQSGAPEISDLPAKEGGDAEGWKSFNEKMRKSHSTR